MPDPRIAGNILTLRSKLLVRLFGQSRAIPIFGEISETSHILAMKWYSKNCETGDLYTRIGGSFRYSGKAI